MQSWNDYNKNKKNLENQSAIILIQLEIGKSITIGIT